MAASSTHPEWLTTLLDNNKKWCSTYTQQHSELCSSLSKGQHPKILWIGCADSRVPETTILNCLPGDVFTHRNIANVVNHTDISLVSIVEYAVKYVGVQHVIVAGHTSCGGVNASLGNARVGKIDTWLNPLRQLRYELRDELKGKTDAEQGRLLVDANVRRSVQVVREMSDVIVATKERGLDVTGVVYDIATGSVELVAGPFDKVDPEVEAAFSLS